MIYLKDGVRLDSLCPQIVLAIMMVDQLNHGGGQFEVYWDGVGTLNERLHVEYDPE